ncbi:hypothetical protein R1A27_16875 [Methylobacterium sp. NMS12]|nr:hypothetical protein [Methylobacterium sp. NMS14P]
MTQAYADQIPALALAMSATILVGVRIASRIHDRNTRRLEARRGD